MRRIGNDKMKTETHKEISEDDFGQQLKMPLKVRVVGRARRREGIGSRSFKVKKFVSKIPENSLAKDKVALLQELEFEDGTKELRLGYYIIGHTGRFKGKWAWGQFALFIPAKDLVKLTEKGKEKGII